MAQHVNVKEYDPQWKALFEKEAQLIEGILGECCKAVHHIGSTAVEGLAAKPVIDIMPVVTDLEAVDRAIPQFEAEGYEYMGELGLPERRYLRKGGIERTHLVQIYADTCTFDIERHLAVRDYLLTHKEVAEEYGALKARLAKKFPNNNEAYCDGKDGFVEALERAALKWYRDGKEWERLYKAAAEVQDCRSLSPQIEVGEVAAAILSEGGKVYLGVSLKGDGFDTCAEMNAAANMILGGEQHVAKMLILLPDGKYATPCGKCRKLLLQIDSANENALVLLSYEDKKAASLKDF